jgi:hypothetical protein
MSAHMPSDRAPDLRRDRSVMHPREPHETLTVDRIDPRGDQRPLLGLRSHA